MAYVYRHIRLDKNTPFYVGIGNDKTYRRANSSDNRNKHWHYVVNKTKYEVEIFIDNVNYEEAKQKEIEFIKIYGRKDLGLGELVNYTDGGQGNTNWSIEKREKFIKSQIGKKVSEETRKRLSESHKGHKPTPEALANMRKAKQNHVITKETREKMAAKLRGRPQPQWQRDILSKSAMGKKVPWSYVPIVQYSINGEYIKDFESIASAARELELQNSNIFKVIKNKRTHTGGFIFKYKTT